MLSEAAAQLQQWRVGHRVKQTARVRQMRGSRFAQQFAQRFGSEDGTIMPFVALGMTALLLFLALALDVGVRFAGRTQLQQLSDAAAQAALVALAKEAATRDDARNARTVAEQAARDIVAQTAIMQDGFSPSRLIVEFGSYDFGQENPQFAPETGMPSGPPQAVRVTADRTGASSFRSLLSGSPIAANAASIAAVRCRNIVFVQDVSASFRDDIFKIQRALRRTVQLLKDQEGLSSTGIRVGLVAFRNIVVPKGSTPELVPPSSAVLEAAINNLSANDVLCAARIQNPNLTTFIVPACAGSDMRSALEEAEELLEPGNGKLAGCEDLVLTISDGVPCKVTPENLDTFPFADVRFGPAPPGEPQGGGSTREETLAFVNDRMRNSGSISVLTANSDSNANPDPTGATTEAELDEFLKICPSERGQNAQQRQQLDIVFAGMLISGFGQSFESTKDEDQVAAEMAAALQSIPPVVVR